MINNFNTGKQIISELNYILNKKQKKRAFVVLLVIIVSSWFELVGVTAILPFIQVVLTPEKVLAYPYVQRIMNVLGIRSANGLLLLMGFGLILVYVGKNLYLLFSYFMQYDFSNRILKELSIKMLNSYMNRPYSYFLDTNSSEVLRGCNSDVGGVYNIISYLSTITSEILATVMIGIFIVYTDPLIAVGILFLMAAVLLGIIFLFKPFMKRAGRKNMLAATSKTKAINQAIMGIKEIFVMQRKECFVEEYEDAAEISRKAQRSYDFINNSPERIIEGICVSGLIGIVCVRLTMATNMLDFVPKLGAFAMAAFKILPSIGKIASRITGIIYCRPMLTNVYQIMKEANACDSREQQYKQEKGTPGIELDDIAFREELSVNHVFWKYKNQKQPVLTDAVLSIKKGESVAFIGTSGAGKTTLADIILGLLRPQKGSIEMDGIDVYTIPKEWARIVGYVPQAVFLLDDTVRNNIIFGLKPENYNDEMVWDALKQAQLKTFVEELPEGLDTIVGERGIKFSGGQKQRIAIARALYNRPEILILDEATAALDTETETAVMESIDALQGTITMIIVAHRLTTIRKCDKIYEIGNGRAVVRDKNDVLKGL